MNQTLIDAYKDRKEEYEFHERTDCAEYKKICQWLEKHGKDKK